MSFLRNDAVNRVDLHSAVQALAQAGGGVFFLIFLLRAGISVPFTLTAQAAIQAFRFGMRPVILPLAKRLGLKPMLIFGTLGLAAQYPLLSLVHGVGGALLALCLVTALGEIFYWPTYNAYFAAPLLGAWALVTLGPRPMFAAVGLVQALAAIPLLGAPNVAVEPAAPGAFRAARLGAILFGLDGWFDASFVFVWQIALFVSLGDSIQAYGGAMALAGLVGAVFGLFLGRYVDTGHGRRAVLIGYIAIAVIVVLRGASLASPWLAVAANALGVLLGALLVPTSTAVSNLAKASPCPIRFYVISEGAWDVGGFCGCLTAAALAAAGVPLAVDLLFGLPALAIAARLLRGYYAS
jgi:DHA1 family inner membrane transport protein